MIFVQAVVFAAQGLALFAAGGTLGLSASETGAGFTFVIIGAGVAAPLPILLIRWIGASRVIVAGLLVLVAGFALLSEAVDGTMLYGAMFLAGAGFSLSANTCGVYLISGWTGPRAGRVIGLYMMIGMLGNAVGPPAAEAMIAAGGWRGYAVAVAVLSAGLAALCLLCLREPPGAAERAEKARWLAGVGQVLRSPIFALLAVATVMTQICLVTVESVAPAHIIGEGLSGALAARLLGIMGVAATVVTGLASFLTVRLSSRWLLLGSLACLAVGMLLLAASNWPVALYGFAILLGVGIGGATLAVTLLLVDYFGAEEGSASLGAIWTLAVLAAVGPWAAGVVADATGSYVPMLAGTGALMVPLALVCLWLPNPVQAGTKPRSVSV